MQQVFSLPDLTLGNHSLKKETPGVTTTLYMGMMSPKVTDM